MIRQVLRLQGLAGTKAFDHILRKAAWTLLEDSLSSSVVKHLWLTISVDYAACLPDSDPGFAYVWERKHQNDLAQAVDAVTYTTIYAN